MVGRAAIRCLELQKGRPTGRPFSLELVRSETRAVGAHASGAASAQPTCGFMPDTKRCQLVT